jgi:hypothetical protein
MTVNNSISTKVRLINKHTVKEKCEFNFLLPIFGTHKGEYNTSFLKDKVLKN